MAEMVVWGRDSIGAGLNIYRNGEIVDNYSSSILYNLPANSQRTGFWFPDSFAPFSVYFQSPFPPSATQFIRTGIDPYHVFCEDDLGTGIKNSVGFLLSPPFLFDLFFVEFLQ